MRSEATIHTLSLGARLTLFYCLAILLATVLFAGVVYWRLQANFTAEHTRFLEAKIAELKVDLNDGHGNPQALLSEIVKETAGTQLRQYEARVLSGARVGGETPGMGADLPVSVFPASISPREVMNHTRPVSARHHRYLIASVMLATGTKPLELQIALDVTRDAALVAAFRGTMILTFLILAPVLVLVGLWIATRGLAPLRRIADAAGAVTPLRLSERIPTIPPWPKELAGLVTVFNAMLERLDEAFGRLSRFSADLAHELRTPLGNLIGEIEVSLRRPRTAEEYRATLESNLEECRRLSTLIEDLLFLARTEHAEVTLHRERIEVRDICDQAIVRLTAAARARDVDVHIEGDADVKADPVLLSQAVANLLSNAVCHAPEGTAVCIRARKADDGTVAITVHNGGVPIAPEHVPHLFDRFYRADPARSHGVGQGTGLGLSIVQSIMALHGGSVAIESTEDAGTTATLFFPSMKSLT
ncbi:MAG: heavy metal sensor histidine kinase [Alphaproteobacteria bacterium]|nr:heavy metal sensor histidine kinase [Alphaproteobacteria bacterium]